MEIINVNISTTTDGCELSVVMEVPSLEEAFALVRSLRDQTLSAPPSVPQAEAKPASSNGSKKEVRTRVAAPRTVEASPPPTPAEPKPEPKAAPAPQPA